MIQKEPFRPTTKERNINPETSLFAENPPLPKLPPRSPESHKGDYGRMLLVGGSRGMAGAVALSGMAALRAGAGLVTLAVPHGILPIVAGFEPSYMTRALPEDEAGRITAGAENAIGPLFDLADAAALGPGLGRSLHLDELVCDWYESYKRPLVCDADALNALADDQAALASPGGPRVLTPHPGEFRRLVGEQLSPEACGQRAVEMARKWQAVVVLKGHHTLVTDGQRTYRNTTGNPGMATGGSGDVLTGVITALLGQALPFEAAQLGVYLHGLAGDLAAAELGETSLIASDLVRFLPQAFRRHQA